MEQRKIVFIETALLLEHELNEGFYGAVVADKDFVETIRERGIIQALIVTPTETLEGKRFKIVSGHRRRAGAIAAGLVEVPCEIKEYDTPEAEEMDLLVSNQYRPKTEAMIRAEYKRWKQILKIIAKQRMAGGTQNEVSRILETSKLGKGEALKTHEIIEQQTGITKYQQELMTIVEDDDYLEKQMNKLRRNFGEKFTADAESALFDGWMEIRRNLTAATATLPEAAAAVKALLQTAESGLGDAMTNGGRKKADKPAKVRTTKPKSKRLKQNDPETRGLTSVAWIQDGEESVAVGYAPGDPDKNPAVMVGTGVYQFAWSDLIETAKGLKRGGV